MTNKQNKRIAYENFLLALILLLLFIQILYSHSFFEGADVESFKNPRNLEEDQEQKKSKIEFAVQEKDQQKPPNDGYDYFKENELRKQQLRQTCQKMRLNPETKYLTLNLSPKNYKNQIKIKNG